MGMVALSQRIASAYSVTSRRRGQVTGLARERRVSRQRIYREASWVRQRLLEDRWQPQIAALQTRIEELQRRNQELAEQVARSVVLDEDKQAEVTTLAQAIGISLPDMRRMWEALLPGRAPSVAKLGRWTKAAGERAGKLLEVLDQFSDARVQEALADEIYVKDPVLMVVEPQSLCWLKGKLVARSELTGKAWADQLETLKQLAQLTSDAGQSLQAGLKELNARRQKKGLPALGAQMDHFHGLHAGSGRLNGLEKKLRGALQEASAAQARLEEAGRQGKPCTVLSNQARARWRKAEGLFQQWSSCVDAWTQVKEALPLVTPEGELNTRERAEAQLSAALSKLPGERFDKCKRLLQHPNTFTFLDRVHEKLQKLPVPAEVREAAVRQECLRQALRGDPEKARSDNPQAGALRGVLLVCAVILQKAGAVGQQALEGVRQIFRESWRASSLVECLNSVLRMQQARHRKMTQGLIDLKRLYWNTHVFRTGRRKGARPYELLGLAWPNVRCWELLKWSPEQLRAQLSGGKVAV